MSERQSFVDNLRMLLNEIEAMYKSQALSVLPGDLQNEAKPAPKNG